VVKQTLYYNKIYLSDKMETNDILNRIKLMMNYDSKKTLTENRLLIEQPTQGQGVDIKKIYDQLRNAVYEMGTDTDMLNTAFDMISKMTNSSELTALDASMNSEPIYGGLNAKYKSLQQLLNGELGGFNCKESKRYTQILSSIPGIKASSECNGRDMIGGSFVITNQPTQKPAENKQTEKKSGLGDKITDYPICVQERAKISKLAPETYDKGIWAIVIGGIYYYANGRTYNPTNREFGDYHCGGPGGGVITPGKSTGAGKEGPTGNSKSGNKTPYPWKDSPSIADVQSGKATIVSGMKGDSVIEIQNLLNASGAKLNPDRKFGRRTSKALIAFQNKSGTTNQKGVVDADTYNKLKGGGDTDEFATTDVGGKFGDSQSATPVSQLVTPKSGEGAPENQSAGKFT